MRHLGSLLMAIVVAPLAWVLLAFGMGQVHPNWEPHAYVWAGPVAALAGAGLLLGVPACLRLSPLGPLVAGVVYLGYGIGGLTVQRLHDLLPSTWTVADRDVPLHVPLDNGSAIALGALLVVAVASARRWRRWPAPAAPAPAAPAPAPSPTVEPDGAADSTPPAAVEPTPAPLPTWLEPTPPTEAPAGEPAPAAEPGTEAPRDETPPAAPEPVRNALDIPRQGVRHAAPDANGELSNRAAQEAAAHERAADIERIAAEQRADAQRAAAEGRAGSHPPAPEPTHPSSPWAAPPRQNRD